MFIDFKVKNYDYSKREGNLDVEAKGVVKSEKFFPFFYEGGKKMIFKPLSKTKPLSTPYFAYSEVIWSHLFHEFFDENIPLYHLAKCEGYSEEVPKYHNYGTIVESVINDQEKLVNIYEYFLKYPDKAVDIKDYVNYCLKFYDYTFFFKTKFLEDNPEIAKEFAKQILYSILRGDQNYHYENIAFIEEDNLIKGIAKPIDHEFSTIFMYLDDDLAHLSLFGRFLSSLDKELNGNRSSVIEKNIDTIVKHYPDLVEEFILSLSKMGEYLTSNPINIINDNYIEPFNSIDFQIGDARYKRKKHEEAKELEKVIEKRLIIPDMVKDNINQEILTVSSLMKNVLTKKLSNR